MTLFIEKAFPCNGFSVYKARTARHGAITFLISTKKRTEQKAYHMRVIPAYPAFQDGQSQAIAGFLRDEWKATGKPLMETSLEGENARHFIEFASREFFEADWLEELPMKRKMPKGMKRAHYNMTDAERLVRAERIKNYWKRMKAKKEG